MPPTKPPQFDPVRDVHESAPSSSSGSTADDHHSPLTSPEVEAKPPQRQQSGVSGHPTLAPTLAPLTNEISAGQTAGGGEVGRSGSIPPLLSDSIPQNPPMRAADSSEASISPPRASISPPQASISPASISPPGASASSSAPTKVHKKRAFSRRSRTGCLTCRRRRIKCDEARPFCHNCLKSHKVCSGYAHVDAMLRDAKKKAQAAKKPFAYAPQQPYSFQSVTPRAAYELAPLYSIPDLSLQYQGVPQNVAQSVSARWRYPSAGMSASLSGSFSGSLSSSSIPTSISTSLSNTLSNSLTPTASYSYQLPPPSVSGQSLPAGTLHSPTDLSPVDAPQPLHAYETATSSGIPANPAFRPMGWRYANGNPGVSPLPAPPVSAGRVPAGVPFLGSLQLPIAPQQGTFRTATDPYVYQTTAVRRS